MNEKTNFRIIIFQKKFFSNVEQRLRIRYIANERKINPY